MEIGTKFNATGYDVIAQAISKCGEFRYYVLNNNSSHYLVAREDLRATTDEMTVELLGSWDYSKLDESEVDGVYLLALSNMVRAIGPKESSKKSREIEPSFVRESVDVLDRPCPTCGSEAYGDDGDKTQLAYFVQRLAWAAKVIRAKVTTRMSIDGNRVVGPVTVEFETKGDR